MVYRYNDREFELERVCAYCFAPEGLQEARKAICKQDESGCWYMCFEEDYLPFNSRKEGGSDYGFKKPNGGVHESSF